MNKTVDERDFCALIHASRAMEEEVKKLYTYLEVCGISAPAFTGEFLADLTEDDAPADKKEGLSLLAGFKQRVCAIFPLDPVSRYAREKKGALFSDIYVEEGISAHPKTLSILSHFPNAKPKTIAHYKDIFNVAGQSFNEQKASPALILAANNGRRIYAGARPCQSFGHDHFYYTSQVKNCLYDCEYCFLRGMYPSGNIVIFVNLEDYFSDIDKLLKEHPVYVSIAYDTDLLSLESFTGIVSDWLSFAAKRPGLLTEIRTKCAAKGFHELIAASGAKDGIILAYTISPHEVATRFEHGAGSFSARKEALLASCRAGLRTRLCLDPILPVPDFERIYGRMIDEIFHDPAASLIEDISIGSFRISAGYIKKMKRAGLTQLSAYPYTLDNGILSYEKKVNEHMLGFVADRLARYYPAEKIFRPLS